MLHKGTLERGSHPCAPVPGNKGIDLPAQESDASNIPMQENGEFPLSRLKIPSFIGNPFRKTVVARHERMTKSTKGE